MKFALLGLDDDTLALCQAILDSSEHELVAFHVEASHGKEARSIAAKLKGGETSREAAVARVAEVTLDELAATAETIIVSRPEAGESRLEDARFLARQDVAIVVSQPLSMSALDCYELEMVCDDVGRSLVPLIPEHVTSHFRMLIDAAMCGDGRPEDEGSIGPLEQVVMQRCLEDRSSALVMDCFARDAVLLSQLCGEVKSVAAMGPDVLAAKYSNLNVQMAGADDRLVRWSVEPAKDKPSCRLTLVGERGSVALEMSNYLRRSEWTCSGANVMAPAEGEPDLAETVVAQLQSTDPPVAKLPTWQDATRGVELTEAVSKSLKKGRTIKLRAEGRGEEDAFKGTMAAAGCAILIGIMVLLFGLAAALFVARTSGIEWIQQVSGIVRYWPHTLLVVLVAFLLIQLLRFLIPQSDDD